MTLNKMIAMALAEQPMSDYEKNDLATRLLEILSHLYMLAGHNLPQPYDLSVIANKLAINLKRDYPTLSLGEVRICLELGVEGLYGEFRVLSITAYSSWLRRYKTSDLRYKAILERQKATQPALPPVSESYNEAANDKFLRRAYEQYLADYPIDRLMPGRIYRLLQKRGILINSRDEKLEAVSKFANYKPLTRLPLSNEILVNVRKEKAMESLLIAFFEKLKTEGICKLPL